MSSTNLSVARVDHLGLLSGIAPGQATISATANGISDLALVTVVPYPVGSVELTPAGETIGVGLSEEFTVVLRDSVGAVLTGRPVAWTSTDPAIAAVNTTGRVDGVAEGTVRIIARANEAADTADVEVVVVPVASVTIVGQSFALVPADRIEYGVIARDSEGKVFRLESLGPVTWATSAPAVVDLEGGFWPNRAIAAAVGDATLSATVAGTTGSTLVTVRMPLFESLTVGGASDNFDAGLSCGRTASGATYCWEGLGDTHLLSGGILTTRPRGVLGDPAFASISAGADHQCGVTATGAAYCWGVGSDGRLGIGSTPERIDRPTPVSGGLSFSAVSAGATHSCGITTAGAAYCWGVNTYGQLGNGTILPSAVPVPVSNGLQFADISAGFVHTCGLTTDGRAYCWGHNASGELGSGTTTHAATPVAVAGGHVFQEVEAGGGRHVLHQTLDDFSCGITTGGDGLCWGSNATAALGAGLADAFSTTPVPVLGDITFQNISTGWRHACGVATDGTAYCWGDDRNGQAGNGPSTSNLPGAVAGGLSWLTVEAGEILSCGIATSGATYCWGNSHGTIPHASDAPVKIAGQP